MCLPQMNFLTGTFSSANCLGVDITRWIHMQVRFRTKHNKQVLIQPTHRYLQHSFANSSCNAAEICVANKQANGSIRYPCIRIITWKDTLQNFSKFPKYIRYSTAGDLCWDGLKKEILLSGENQDTTIEIYICIVFPSKEHRMDILCVNNRIKKWMISCLHEWFPDSLLYIHTRWLSLQQNIFHLNMPP